MNRQMNNEQNEHPAEHTPAEDALSRPESTTPTHGEERPSATARASAGKRPSTTTRPTPRRVERSTRIVGGTNAKRTSGSHAAPGSDGRNVKSAIVIALLIALVLAAIVAAVVIIGQPNGNTSSSSAASQVSQPSGESLSTASDAAQEKPDTKALTKLLGKETAEKLVKQAETNEDAAWIASHVDSFALDGIEVQTKILKLAAEEPKALPYVRLFATGYPEKKADKKREATVAESEFKGTEFDTKVPHFFQWDNRWGQTVYSSTTFGLTGCGPTSMAMVYQAITGKTDLNPFDMGQLAQENGYMAEFNGTGSGFFYFVAAQNDFSCTDLPISGQNITEALSSGKIIIANLAEGYFTDNGHFFVLAGLDDDGKVIVNDPYSYERSTKTWDADFIANESMALFLFSNDPYPWESTAWSYDGWQSEYA